MSSYIEATDEKETDSPNENELSTTENTEVSAFHKETQEETKTGRISLDTSNQELHSEKESDNSNIEPTDTVSDSDSKKADYPAQSVVSIDGERYRTDDNGNIHMYYDKDSKYWCMMPNTEYESRGYKYKTDSDGNIVHAEGKLRLSDERQALNDRLEGMEEGDDRGHIIAARFDASNHRDNLVPQLSEKNRGEYMNMEKELAKAAKDKEVYVSWELDYSDNPKRPDTITVNYSIDGKQYCRVFDNRKENHA